MLPRILILQLISSYQLNDLMNRFFNHWKLHLPTTAKQMIQWAKVSIFKLGQFCVNIYLFIRKFSFCFIFLFYIFIYFISSTLHISVYLVTKKTLSACSEIYYFKSGYWASILSGFPKFSCMQEVESPNPLQLT